jgi:putative phosphoesterase
VGPRVRSDRVRGGCLAASEGPGDGAFRMNVAVISDTHLPRGSRVLPDACVTRLRAADLILHGGDLLSLAFLEELSSLGPPVHAVHGNADEQPLKELLPRELVITAGAVQIGIVHNGGPAAGRPERLAARFPDCAAVVYGHSHLPEVVRAGATWILNPGSPTERRRAPERTMLELRIEGTDLAPELVSLGT